MSPCSARITALVELVVGLGLGLGRLDGASATGLAERLGAALHLEVHADLEQLQRRQLADRLGAGELAPSTSSVPSSPSGESGSVAIVNQMLNSWLRR
jgi:hypothetical protein